MDALIDLNIHHTWITFLLFLENEPCFVSLVFFFAEQTKYVDRSEKYLLFFLKANSLRTVCILCSMDLFVLYTFCLLLVIKGFCVKVNEFKSSMINDIHYIHTHKLSLTRCFHFNRCMCVCVGGFFFQLQFRELPAAHQTVSNWDREKVCANAKSKTFRWLYFEFNVLKSKRGREREWTTAKIAYK